MLSIFFLSYWNLDFDVCVCILFIDVKKADHHVRECSPAAPNESKSDATSKPKQSKEQHLHTNVEQNTKDENKCHKCQETFDKCKGIILENPSLAIKDLLKLIKSKHRHQRHKQIEGDSVSLISDFLVESKDFGKYTYTLIFFFHFTKLFPERKIYPFHHTNIIL